MTSSVVEPGLTAQHAWAVLRAVPDPEIPVISVVDLGIVREVNVDGDQVHVVVTPTYAGCPATEVIARDIVDALRAAGAATVRVDMRLAPAWTTDWIDADARTRLRAYGIVPPQAQQPSAASERPLRYVPQAAALIDCPRCGSGDTERLSAFGATPCKALYRCRACREPFEYFKPL